MKNNLPANPFFFKTMLLVTCFMLVILYNKSKANEVTPAGAAKMAINFSHDSEKHELNVTVKADRTANFQLYLFSADGILVKEVPVSSLKITRIKDLPRGVYVYECFNKDTRMKSGTLIIK